MKDIADAGAAETIMWRPFGQPPVPTTERTLNLAAALAGELD